MRVRVDEAGEQQSPGELDDRRVGSAQGEHVAVGSDLDDALAPYGDRLGLGASAIDRPDPTAAQDQVGVS